MIEPFIIRAIISGIGVAIIAGAIGCFVVWRKMAYFGDSLAHSALLGVALGLVFGISTNIGTIIICSIFTITLIWLQQKKILATDTLLGILAHSALSVGMVTLSLLERSVDLHSYLFGLDDSQSQAFFSSSTHPGSQIISTTDDKGHRHTSTYESDEKLPWPANPSFA